MWSIIGAISQVCDLPVTTAVTCPTMRTHPAIIAQAAATSAVPLGTDRFCLGLGSGEALNEHILGDVWPSADTRLEMLEEAVDVIRKLWTGEDVTHRGKHYTVENARIWTLPETPPRIAISGFGPKATDLAARIGDAYVTTKPDQELLKRFRSNAKSGASAQAGVKVAWAPTETRASTWLTRSGRTPAFPASLPRCFRRSSTSSRPPAWSPGNRPPSQ